MAFFAATSLSEPAGGYDVYGHPLEGAFGSMSHARPVPLHAPGPGGLMTASERHASLYSSAPPAVRAAPPPAAAPVPTSPDARWAQALVAVDMNRALLFGGFGLAGYLSDAWVMTHSRIVGSESARTSISRVPELADRVWPTARSNHAAVSLPRACIIHGGGLKRERFDDMFAFLTDARSGSLVCHPIIARSGSIDRPPARAFHAAAPMAHASFMVFGGQSLDGSDLDDVVIYHVHGLLGGPSPLSWTAQMLRAGAPAISASLWPCARRCHALALHGRSNASPVVIVMHGGCVGAAYDVLADLWILQTCPSPRAGVFLAHLLTYSGGGGAALQETAHQVPYAWRRIAASDATGAPPCGRWGHSITSVPGTDHFIMFGGFGGQPGGPGADLNDCYILSVGLSPAATVSHVRWSQVAFPSAARALIPAPRRRHSAAHVRGSILIFGGFDGRGYFDGPLALPTAHMLAWAGVMDTEGESPPTSAHPHALAPPPAAPVRQSMRQAIMSAHGGAAQSQAADAASQPRDEATLAFASGASRAIRALMAPQPAPLPLFTRTEEMSAPAGGSSSEADFFAASAAIDAFWDDPVDTTDIILPSTTMPASVAPSMIVVNTLDAPARTTTSGASAAAVVTATGSVEAIGTEGGPVHVPGDVMPSLTSRESVASTPSPASTPAAALAAPAPLPVPPNSPVSGTMPDAAAASVAPSQFRDPAILSVARHHSTSVPVGVALSFAELEAAELAAAAAAPSPQPAPSNVLHALLRSAQQPGVTMVDMHSPPPSAPPAAMLSHAHGHTGTYASIPVSESERTAAVARAIGRIAVPPAGATLVDMPARVSGRSTPEHVHAPSRPPTDAGLHAPRMRAIVDELDRVGFDAETTHAAISALQRRGVDLADIDANRVLDLLVTSDEDAPPRDAFDFFGTAPPPSSAAPVETPLSPVAAPSSAPSSAPPAMNGVQALVAMETTSVRIAMSKIQAERDSLQVRVTELETELEAARRALQSKRTEGASQGERIEAMREAFTCHICEDARVSVVFEPCGHLACCEACYARLRSGAARPTASAVVTGGQSVGQLKCHVCRAVVLRGHKCFLPAEI